jgi:membrane protein implicated in regulation of membrane protease activity
VIWLIAGVLLLIAEAPVPGLYLMWLGLAAIGTAVVTLTAGLRLEAEVAVFAVLAAISVAVGWRLRRPRVAAVNTPQSGLAGRAATALAFRGAEGRVRVGDSDWPARMIDGIEPTPHAALRVVGVDGTTLLTANESRTRSLDPQV